MGEQGGWPLTMFLTPQGEPFWGGTYFPPEPRYGRPSLPQVLTAMARAYRDDRDNVAKNVAAMKQALEQLGAPQAGDDISSATTDQAAARLAGRHRFRSWRLRRRAEISASARARNSCGAAGGAAASAACATPTVLTLDHICQGGIYDHLGGGFARYSVDARWLAPHFEKMLYDNALLIDLMTAVWQDTHSPLYAERIAETHRLDRSAKCASPKAAFPPASTPTASMRKASSTSGARPRSTPRSASAPRASSNSTT